MTERIEVGYTPAAFVGGLGIYHKYIFIRIVLVNSFTHVEALDISAQLKGSASINF